MERVVFGTLGGNSILLFFSSSSWTGLQSLTADYETEIVGRYLSSVNVPLVRVDACTRQHRFSSDRRKLRDVIERSSDLDHKRACLESLSGDDVAGINIFFR